MLRVRLGEERLQEARRIYLEMGRRAANAIVESGSDTDTDTNDEGESSEIIGHLSQFPGSPRSPKTNQIAQFPLQS